MKDWRGKYKEREKSGVAPSVDPPRANIHYVFICARLPHMISGCPFQWFGRQPPSSTQAPVFLWPFQPIVEERSRLWRAMRLQCNLSVWSVHGSALSWSGVPVIKVLASILTGFSAACLCFSVCVCGSSTLSGTILPFISPPSHVGHPDLLWQAVVFAQLARWLRALEEAWLWPTLARFGLAYVWSERDW